MTDYIEIVSHDRPTAIQRLARDAKKIKLSPKAVYSDGQGLPDCETVEDVRDWLGCGYDKFHEKVVKGSQQFRLSEETRDKSLALLLDPAATSIFTLNDRNLMLRAFDIILPEFIGYVQADPNNEIVSVAFICGSGGSSLDRPDIPLAASQARARDILHKMSRHWFAMTECAFFNSKRHVTGGRHLQQHTHAILWAPGTHAKAAEIARKYESSFEPNVTEADRIRVVEAWDNTDVNLARLLAYLLKAPSFAMNYVPPRDGKPGFMNHSEKGDRPINYYRLAILQSMMTFKDASFASIQGLAMQKSASKATDEIALTVGGRCPAFHQDEIPAFWTDVLREGRWGKARLPIVRRS